MQAATPTVIHRVLFIEVLNDSWSWNVGNDFRNPRSPLVIIGIILGVLLHRPKRKGIGGVEARVRIISPTIRFDRAFTTLQKQRHCGRRSRAAPIRVVRANEFVRARSRKTHYYVAVTIDHHRREIIPAGIGGYGVEN